MHTIPARGCWMVCAAAAVIELAWLTTLAWLAWRS